MAKRPAQEYQTRVTLDDIRPPIWWRILVLVATTLVNLHDILQIVMAWQGSHLHKFTIGGQHE